MLFRSGTALGLNGWDGKHDLKGEGNKNATTGSRQNFLGRMFRRQKDGEKDEEKKSNTTGFHIIPSPPPPYDPPEYDDEISCITDRVFAPKRKSPTSHQPKQENIGASGQFSVNSSRRKSSHRNTERSLEDLNPILIKHAAIESLPLSKRKKNEKRNTRTALAGLAPLSLPQYKDLVEEKERGKVSPALLSMEIGRAHV